MHKIPAILLFLVAMTTQSCIHTYPNGEADDPSRVDVAIEISVDIKWGSLLSYHPDSRSTGNHYRIIVEIFSEDNIFARMEKFVDPDDFGNKGLRVHIPERLRPEKYTIAVWCDMCTDDIPEPFDATSLSGITPVLPRSDIATAVMSGFATTVMDLTSYRNQLDSKIIIPLILTSPAARIQFTATDVDAFLRHVDSALIHGEKYSVTLSYESAVPIGFNARSGTPFGYYEANEISSPMPVLFATQATICSDWLFAGDTREEISATITIYNSARCIVSRRRGIRFPVERGKITTVRGDFLTNFYTNDININNIWDEEIIIEVE